MHPPRRLKNKPQNRPEQSENCAFEECWGYSECFQISHSVSSIYNWVCVLFLLQLMIYLLSIQSITNNNISLKFVPISSTKWIKPVVISMPGRFLLGKIMNYLLARSSFRIQNVCQLYLLGYSIFNTKTSSNYSGRLVHLSNKSHHLPLVCLPQSLLLSN